MEDQVVEKETPPKVANPERHNENLKKGIYTMACWAARDKDGALVITTEAPVRNANGRDCWDFGCDQWLYWDDRYGSVEALDPLSWSDEPVQIELVARRVE